MIDMSNNRANVAFRGSRNDVWHRLGQEMTEGQSIEEWAKAAGLGWTALKVPAMADVREHLNELSPQAPHFSGMVPARDRSFMVRSDTFTLLGDNCVSDIYQPVQPAEVLDWFDRYIRVDDRFQLDVAGALKGGSIIWATATYRDKLDVAGDAHVARVLMSTTFDGSGATINQATMTRVVCNNTLRLAHGTAKAIIRTRHNTRFDAARVGKELAQLASGFADFKAMGDAMAAVELSKDYVRDFFKQCLDIPLEAKSDELSTRKMNQFRALSTAYSVTRRERNAGTDAPADAWTALQAITRWVDHDRTSINGDNGEKQFTSANFGSGDAVKGKAMALLLPLLRDKVAA